MRVIRGRRALVTGAASGIGRAIALDLAREGADLLLVDIKREELEAVAAEARRHGVAVLTSVRDLSQPAEVSAAVRDVLAAWGGLNILINNAGVAYYGKTHEMTDPQWNRVIAVNLLAPIQMTRELFPALLAADEAHILNMCSMFGITPWRKTAAYQTSKYGLVGFSQALHAEYHRAHFGVTALCPGFVDTPLLEGATPEGEERKRSAPPFVSTTPEKVSAKAIDAIRRNRGLVVVTPHAQFYWRLTRLSPRLVGWLLRHGWRKRDRIVV
jgi:3-oxoacyl-[acyl-carrier protein] reductase